MSLDERVLSRIQESLVLRSFERGKPIKPLPPRNPWPALSRVWRGPEGPFVETVYQEILGREADAGGKAGFLPALNHGMPRAQMVRSLLASPEAKQQPLTLDWLPAMDRLDASQPFTRPGWILGTADPREFIVQCYRRLLGRAPGEGEVAKWIKRFRLPILGRRTNLIHSLERSKERAVLLLEMEQERLDGRFADLHESIRLSQTKLEQHLTDEREASRLEVERLTGLLQQSQTRDAELQQRLEVAQRAIQSLEMFTQRLSTNRPVFQSVPPSVSLPRPSKSGCRLCGGTLSKQFTRRVFNDQHEGEFFQCHDCEMLQIADPYWLNDVDGESSSFASNFAAFGNLLACAEAKVWNPIARYLDIGSDGVLTQMLRDHGCDAWACNPHDSADPFARNYRYSTIGEIASGCIDVATAFTLLERLTDPGSFGAELRKVLAPTATAVFSAGIIDPDTDLESWPNLECESGRKVTFWSRKSLAHFAEQLGFASVGYIPTDEKFTIVFSPLNCGDLDARLEKAQTILNRDGFLAETIRTWNPLLTSPRYRSLNQTTEAARSIPRREELRCAS